jgi:predicted hydrolase (HD superfamily)
MTPREARALMEEWTQSEALRGHMECVAACMGACAAKYAPAERDRWVIAGLLHDMDYERHPGRDSHPFVAVEHLRSRGDVDDEIIDAILGHAEYTGVPRRTLMARALYAVDELAGFIVACCKVRPKGIADLEPASVRKKLHDRAFAAAVSREDIARGIEELGADPAEHIRTCIDGIRAELARPGVAAAAGGRGGGV